MSLAIVQVAEELSSTEMGKLIVKVMEKYNCPFLVLGVEAIKGAKVVQVQLETGQKYMVTV